MKVGKRSLLASYDDQVPASPGAGKLRRLPQPALGFIANYRFPEPPAHQKAEAANIPIVGPRLQNEVFVGPGAPLESHRRKVFRSGKALVSAHPPPGLSHTDPGSHGEPASAFEHSASYDAATAPGAHPGPEAVDPAPASSAWLICSLGHITELWALSDYTCRLKTVSI